MGIVAFVGAIVVTDPRRRPAVHTGPDPSAWDAAAVRALRQAEYARLDADDHAYLDYTGAGLYAESQIRAHQALLERGVFGNPHSDSPSSRASTELADRARAAILAFVGA